MAVKDNVSAREGVGAVITVHADIKVAWIYITSVTRCKKKMHVLERAQSAEGINHRQKGPENR